MGRTITEIYLLVHPFYNLDSAYWKSVCEDFLKLWQESIKNVSQKEGSYGILIQSTSPNVPKEFVDEITNYFTKSFPWSRRSVLKNPDGAPIHLLKPRILGDVSKVERVSARGIYVNQCVVRALSELLQRLSIPREKAHIDWYESDTGYLPKGFPETKYETGTGAKLILPPSRPTLEENIHYTQRLLNGQ